MRSTGSDSHFPSGRGFSLAELVLSTGIVALLLLVLMYAYRNNLISFKSGTIELQNQQGISLLTKRIYTDFKNLNPAIYFDSEYHLWFQGEKTGDLYPNLVELEDLDGDKTNGFEKVTLNQSSIREIGDKPQLQKIFYEWRKEKEELARGSGGIEKIVARKVSEFHIQPNPDSKKHLSLTMTLGLLDTEIKKKQSETIHLAIAMDTDLIFVKTGSEK